MISDNYKVLTNKFLTAQGEQIGYQKTELMKFRANYEKNIFVANKEVPIENTWTNC